jgi:hypothetical protein
MTTISHIHETGGAARADNRPPWCPGCNTDATLMIDSIDSLHPPEEGLVQVSYTCRSCGFFYSHPATVPAIAAILNRPTS